MFDLRDFLKDNRLNENVSESEESINEANGYVELMLMDKNFEKGVDSILRAFKDWKNGPLTEPNMVKPAKEDVVEYIKSELDKIR